MTRVVGIVFLINSLTAALEITGLHARRNVTFRRDWSRASAKSQP